MKAKDILNILTTPWCSNQDIMKIVNVSSSTASKIKRCIEIEFRRSIQINLYQLTVYFDIDIEFLNGLASIDFIIANEHQNNN